MLKCGYNSWKQKENLHSPFNSHSPQCSHVISEPPQLVSLLVQFSIPITRIILWKHPSQFFLKESFFLLFGSKTCLLISEDINKKQKPKRTFKSSTGWFLGLFLVYFSSLLSLSTYFIYKVHRPLFKNWNHRICSFSILLFSILSWAFPCRAT